MKPTIKINPENGQADIYYIFGYASGELLQPEGAGRKKIEEMSRRVRSSRSYEEAIRVIEEYVNIEWEGGVPM